VDVVCHRQQQQQPTQPTAKTEGKKQYTIKKSVSNIRIMQKERIPWEEELKNSR
jgi:hypothetical protein